MERSLCQLLSTRVGTEWCEELTYEFLTAVWQDAVRDTEASTKSWKKICTTCADVILAVSIALLSWLYLSLWLQWIRFLSWILVAVQAYWFQPALKGLLVYKTSNFLRRLNVLTMRRCELQIRSGYVDVRVHFVPVIIFSWLGTHYSMSRMFW